MDDNRITIDLEFRKEEAERRLKQFEEKARIQFERFQKVQARYAANPNGFTRQQLTVSRNWYNRRMDDVIAGRNAVHDIDVDLQSARRAGITMSEIFKSAVVTSAISGGLRWAADNAIGLAYKYSLNPGGNNADARILNSTANGFAGGLSSGALAGAAIGSIIPGVGTVIGGFIGAGIGAFGGGLTGYIGSKRDENYASNDARIRRDAQLIYSDKDSYRGIRDFAFGRMLSMQARPARIQMLLKRLEEVESGSGSLSIKSLRKSSEAYLERGDHESVDFQRNQALLQKALGDRDKLRAMIAEERSYAYYRFIDPSGLVNSKARMGLYAGGDMFKEGNKNAPFAGIDFDKLTNPVVDELRKINQNLSNIAGSGDTVKRSADFIREGAF